jgi:hypothetical protein
VAIVRPENVLSSSCGWLWSERGCAIAGGGAAAFVLAGLRHLASAGYPRVRRAGRAACVVSAQTRAATSIAAEYLPERRQVSPSSGLFLREFSHSLLLGPAAAADHHGDRTRRRVGKKRTRSRAVRTAWRGRFAPSHGNHDLSSGVSFSLVPESVRDITQGEAPIDDRRDLAGFD